MSAVTEYLAVAVLAVSLGACSTHASYMHAVGPQQVATSRPEEVRLRLGPHPVASDTLGRDNPVAHAVQMSIEAAAKGQFDIMVLRDAIALGIGFKGIVVGSPRPRSPAIGGHHSPRYPATELCKMCPSLVMKRS
jgi:hypothetical protein